MRGQTDIRTIFVISETTPTMSIPENIRHIWRAVASASLPAILSILSLTSCGAGTRHSETSDPRRLRMNALQDTLEKVAAEYPAEIGIALVTGQGDTITVNNQDKYPLMSVFKLHQAISLAHSLHERGISLDTVVSIDRASLNPDTWSPMLKDYTASRIEIPVSGLLRYTLTQSDNNASNYLFSAFQSPAAADSIIASIIPRDSFRITCTEEDMWSDHSLCYANHSSPLGAAILIDRLYTDSILPSSESRFLRKTLRECTTGTDRIVAPLADKEGVTAGHKTGSGFRNERGILTAHNDVAFITLPNGHHYSLAVLVKDFNGAESDAARAIARISELVYTYLADSIPSKN